MFNLHDAIGSICAFGLFPQQGCYRINMCIRDENNEFMCAKTILVNANKTPQEAKAVCLPDVLN